MTGREKLVAILGMLGSGHAGERDAAALAATNLLHKMNTTWDAVIMPEAPVPVPVNAAQEETGRTSQANATYQAQMNQAWAQYASGLNAYNPYGESGLGGLGI